jgi:hypothetical protein
MGAARSQPEVGDEWQKKEDIEMRNLFKPLESIPLAAF